MSPSGSRRRPRAPHACAALAATVALAGCGDGATAPKTLKSMSTAAAAYLNSALAFEDTVFYYHSKVNFPAQQKAVRDSGNALGAQKTADTYGAIQYSIDPFLRNAGDQHSDFWEPSEAPGTVDSPASDPRYQVSGLMLPAAAGVRAANPVAYLWFPTYDGTNDNGRADSTQTVIRTLDQNSPCGWVLDLRFNPGGQPTAMMAGLNPLIGDTPVSRTQRGFGGWVDYEDFVVYLYAQKGQAGAYDPSSGTKYPQVTASAPYTLRRPGSPVAILTGPATASAGELLTLGFRSGPVPYRVFGEPTYGVSTVPYNTTLSDGAYLNITAAVMMDRTGQLYGGKLTPDVAVAGPSYRSLLPSTPATSPDTVVKAATAWLQSLPACGGTATVASAPAFSRDVSGSAPPTFKPGRGIERVSRHWTTRAIALPAPTTAGRPGR